MINIPKDKPKISLESELEKLYQMKNVIKYTSSQISNDYSLHILESRIEEVEAQIRENEWKSMFKDKEEVFDTQKYADKAKNPK